MNPDGSADGCSRLIPDTYGSGLVFCGRIPSAVQLGPSIINVPVFLLACFGAT